MTVPYVCSTCCNRIARQTVLSGKRQVAFASSHALEGVVPERALNSQSGRQPRYSRSPAGISNAHREYDNPQHSGHNSPHVSDDFTSYITKAATNSPGRYSRQPQSRPEASRSQQGGHPQQPSRPSRSYTSELEDLLKVGKISQAWTFFEDHFTNKTCPALSRPSFRDVAKVRSGAVIDHLLSKVVTEWQARLQTPAESSGLPSPLNMIKKYEELGLASSAAYSKLLWRTSLALTGCRPYVSATYESQYQDEIHQLMSIWKLCLSRQSADRVGDVLTDSNPSPPSWSFVPHDFQMQRRGHSKYFDDCFALFVPCGPLEKGRFNALAASALLTHDLLTSGWSGKYESSNHMSYADFSASMEMLIQNTMMDSQRLTTLSRWLREACTNGDVVKDLMRRLEARFFKAGPANVKASSTTQDTIEAPFQILINRLGRAVERHDLDAAEKLWVKAEVLLQPPQPIPSPNGDPRINMCEQFLIAFFRLRRPQSALQVWNAMVQSGVQPTVRTWTAMMKGCQISKDVVIMESMWHRMRASGVQPDVHAWSTRIHGLIKVGKVQEGIQALDEMSREWSVSTRQGLRAPTLPARHAAVEGDSKESIEFEVPKPDTAILNSALIALGERGKKYIPNILTWGRGMGIDPDVITYNSLLNVSLAQGEHDETMNILRNMADAKVVPDSSTFTILLNAMFHSSVLKGLEHDEQEDRIMDFITSLEGNGLQIDEKGYGILVDRLLKEYGNLRAAHRVLGHMADAKVAPTPHIYTILMTHYFDANPPNLAAVDALWNDISSRNNNYGVPLDVIFFDRMIEGYARHGKVGRTMAFLTRMSKEGKRPGWLAMTAVIRCLADKNEWDRLTQIVMDCHRQEGLLSAGLRGTKGQADFWQLARDLGVHLPVEVAT